MVVSCFKFRAEWQTDRAARAGSNVKKPEERLAYWARREGCEVFFCKEMSQESLFPDFLAVHAPLTLLRRQTLNHSVDTRSCSVQWSFENRATTRITKKRGTIVKKTWHNFLLRNQHILELEPHYGCFAVHNCLLKALFLPHLVSLSIKVTEHQFRSHLPHL